MTTATKQTNGHALAAPQSDWDVMEQVVVNGDLARLTPAQRLSYYRMRCEAAGIDPRAQPFQYIILNNKLQLYATKATADQLIAGRKLGVEIIDRRFDERLYIYEVRVRVTFPDGHSVENMSAVSVTGLKGEALCNAVMKAVTKGIRRTVLSACGLGMLDESEVETIPGARPAPEDLPPVPLQREHPPQGSNVPRGECSAWIQARIDETENEWSSLCVKHKVAHAHLGDKGKRLNVYQVINGIVSDWLEDDPPLIEADMVNTDGKRDRAKVLQMIRHQWAADDDGEGLMDDVRQYLRAKLDAAAQAARINLDAEPAEVTADA